MSKGLTAISLKPKCNMYAILSNLVWQRPFPPFPIHLRLGELAHNPNSYLIS